MTLLSDELAAYIDQAVKKALASVRTAVGTVVTSPSQVSTDPLAVVLDGGSVAVQVKGFRGLPVFPGARVALVRFGSDWTIVGAYTNPGAGTGSSRIVIGSDVPAELRAFGVDTAILTYITDHLSGLEVGYFFIGGSNRFDAGGNNRVQAFGDVTYPTPGVPSSATTGNVKTHFQQQMDSPFPQTTFKDHEVVLWTSMVLSGPNSSGAAKLDYTRNTDGFLGVRIDDNYVRAGQPGSNNAESWHTLTLSNSWTGTLKYKLCAAPDRFVWLLGNLTPGTKTDGTTIGTLPTGYRPATGHDVMGAATPAVTTQSPHFNVTTGGAIQCYGYGSATGGSINGPISLDF